MSEFPEFSELMHNGALRRLWLLYRAVSAVPFERAVELARAAEVFVAGASPELLSADAPSDATAQQAHGQAMKANDARLADAPVATTDRAAIQRSGVALSEEQRDRLLTRLAKGGKNGTLAAEFGLSPKQVQGIRMGSAREIARRRAQRDSGELQPQTAAANIDEIIRYLRQQDDVIVSQEDGSYLVNGRFRMTIPELRARANRMRARQRKPMFDPRDAAHSADIPGEKHPLFWQEQENC